MSNSEYALAVAFLSLSWKYVEVLLKVCLKKCGLHEVFIGEALGQYYVSVLLLRLFLVLR